MPEDASYLAGVCLPLSVSVGSLRPETTWLAVCLASVRGPIPAAPEDSEAHPERDRTPEDPDRDGEPPECSVVRDPSLDEALVHAPGHEGGEHGAERRV